MGSDEDGEHGIENAVGIICWLHGGSGEGESNCGDRFINYIDI